MEIRDRIKVKVNSQVSNRVKAIKVLLETKDNKTLEVKAIVEDSRIKPAVLRISKVIRVVLKEDHNRITRDNRHKAVSREVNKVLAKIRMEDKLVDSKV